MIINDNLNFFLHHTSSINEDMDSSLLDVSADIIGESVPYVHHKVVHNIHTLIYA